jgi:hypothetical protein
MLTLFEESNFLFQKYSEIISQDVTDFTSGVKRLKLPFIRASFLTPFLNEITNIFKSESILPEL